MLWTHQQEAIDWARGRREVILHLGMGCGKTRTALEIINEALTARGIRRILVGSPKAVMPAWAKQAGLWMPALRVILLDRGTSADKGKAVTAALASTTPVLIVCNYESLWRIKEVEKQSWDVFVWDEVHRLKSPSGSASKWAAKMGKKNPTAIRIALSGTLLAHSPLDAFGVYRAVESPECQTFGASYTIFKATFAITNPHLPGMVIGYRNQKQFAQKLADTTFHRRSEDVLDLPPIHHVEVPVELTPKEARVYVQLEKEFCAEVDGGYITPANAMVALLRMLQACSGFMRLDDAAAATQIDEQPSKRAAFAEMLEDIAADEPVVVFCRFRSDIDAVIHVCQQLGRGVSELSGRIDNLAEWQAGKTAVLVAQIQSGGIGIDLTRASIGIFYSLGHSLSEWLQAIARLHRPGQERHTRFFSLVSCLLGKTTADGRVYSALTQRKEVVDGLLESYRTRHNHAFGAAGTGRGDRS
jgi:superfamily II DNA or RNA helicase